MIEIDGTFGEGGGQILRTSLGLSLVTGTAFRIDNIRAKRKQSGLLRQHLTAVLAAAKIGQAEVIGAELGSGAITFVPGKVLPGEYTFSVGRRVARRWCCRRFCRRCLWPTGRAG